MPIPQADYEFLMQYRSIDGFACECDPGDYHEVEASDWRRIAQILENILDGVSDQ